MYTGLKRSMIYLLLLIKATRATEVRGVDWWWNKEAWLWIRCPHCICSFQDSFRSDLILTPLLMKYIIAAKLSAERSYIAVLLIFCRLTLFFVFYFDLEHSVASRFQTLFHAWFHFSLFVWPKLLAFRIYVCCYNKVVCNIGEHRRRVA